MKITYLILSLSMLIITATSMNFSKRDTVCPKLYELLEDYIENGSHADIITIKISCVNGKSIVTFSDNERYDRRRIDYYFKIRNKLVAIYAVDSVSYKDIPFLFNTDSLIQFKGNIHGYKDKDATNDYIHISNYEPCVKTYQMIDHELFNEKIAETSKEYIAKDSNAIKSSDMNDVINNYINQHPSALYLLKFKKVNGKLYFVFENSEFYERKNFDGYFFRNKHLIVLYNIKGIHNLIKPTEICQSEPIRGYKQNVLKTDWLLNSPVFYEVQSNGNLFLVKDFSICYEITL